VVLTLLISRRVSASPDALRPLSLNQHLTHLTIRGNPISQKVDYRVLLLAMIPSVLMLDDKKIRATTKSRAPDGPMSKSLSYCTPRQQACRRVIVC
jgi:hypothetical protein